MDGFPGLFGLSVLILLRLGKLRVAPTIKEGSEWRLRNETQAYCAISANK